MTELLAVLDRHTAALLATAATFTDDDLAAGSLCAGWTRGHVLSHLARNAEGLTRLARAALEGTGETMYASTEARDADIEAGARRPVAEQVRDLTETAAALEATLRRLGPDQEDQRHERTPGGMLVRIGNLPAMRLREVVYHHIDLQAGLTFDRLDSALDEGLLDRFLTVELRSRRSDDPPPRLTVRTLDGGDGGAGAEWVLGTGDDGRVTVTGSRAGVLGWLARDLSDGVRVEA